MRKSYYQSVPIIIGVDLDTPNEMLNHVQHDAFYKFVVTSSGATLAALYREVPSSRYIRHGRTLELTLNTLQDFLQHHLR